MTIEQLAPYLVLSGVTILGVMFSLWRQARRHSRISLALIRLNQTQGFDTLGFLRQAWPLLAETRLDGFSWEADWYSSHLSEGWGDTKQPSREERLEVGEITVSVRFHHRKARGENRFFNESIEQTLLLLLRTDLWIKEGSAEKTFQQMARLSLFLQHDMKNIAQFIQLTADQVALVKPEQALRLVERLKISMPLLRQRADNIVETLMLRENRSEKKQTVDLRALFERILAIHGLSGQVFGEGCVYLPERPLEAILDNILRNYAELDGGSPTCVSGSLSDSAGQVEIRIQAVGTAPPPRLERLFEPFWSGTGKGLGIGLYQAREGAKGLGGNLVAHLDASGSLVFVLTLPGLHGESTR